MCSYVFESVHLGFSNINTLAIPSMSFPLLFYDLVGVWLDVYDRFAISKDIFIICTAVFFSWTEAMIMSIGWLGMFRCVGHTDKNSMKKKTYTRKWINKSSIRSKQYFASTSFTCCCSYRSVLLRHCFDAMNPARWRIEEKKITKK